MRTPITLLNITIFNAVGLITLIAYPLLSAAYDGTVNITGNILAESCTVASSDTTKSVDMGGYSSGMLTEVGQTTTFKTFSISLHGCSSSISGTTILISGTPDATNSKLLQLSNPSDTETAKGVAVLVADEDGNSIDINKSSSLKSLTAGDNQVSFQLAYEVTKLPVSSGSASAVMYLDFSYQ